MSRVVLATRNPGKVRELVRLLEVDLVSLLDVGPVPPVVEDGETFEANAAKKAREVALATGLPALADDSGLEVDALGGAPGVRSARYAGPSATDEDNNRKLLEGLRGVADAERTARFRCALAFVDPGGKLGDAAHVAYGVCEGSIGHELRGAAGFGYDPLFIPAGYRETMAQLGPQVKAGIGHRGAAARAMAPFLADYLQPG